MGGITTIINKVKYIGIASLTIAILSVLILNIISSYSSSRVDSSAEPIGLVSVLANDSICDPSNTNAPSCISLSITSSSSTGGNDANLSLSIPQGGGIATGRHTVEVSSNNVAGYYVMLTGNAGSPAMTPSATTSQAFIQSTTGTLTNPSPLAKGQWGSWGIALPNSSLYPGFNTNEADYNSTNQDTLAKTTWAAVPSKETDDNTKTIVKTTTSSKKTDTYPVYYGVMVDNPVSVPADTYAAQVVYTATTNEVPVPTITNLSKNSYELGSGASSQITISGANLGSTYEVYLTNTNGDRVGECTNLNVIDNSNISCTIPTIDITAGSYTIHVITQGGEDSTGFTYTEPKTNSVSADYGNAIGSVQVDYDKNMIPIIYDESASTWRVVTDAQLQQNPDNWFNYIPEEKRWANALTVSQSSLQSFRDKQSGADPDTTIQTVDNPDILGYWVYIPRYAYEVQRRDATDKYVTEGKFEIMFETASSAKKYPAESCNAWITTARDMWKDGSPGGPDSDILAKDYRTGCNIDRTYYAGGDETIDTTTWATHPAFTLGNDELNGFWFGKFETTGTRTSPTIKPNQHPNVGETIGEFMTMAKSIGVEDPKNVGGSTVDGIKANVHGLDRATTHLAKNSEWGAVVYLANSDYGNSNKVYPNTGGAYGSADADGDSTGTSWHSPATGCGNRGANGGQELSSSLIESPKACDDRYNPDEPTPVAYDGTGGQQSSTTGNIYGVYDMAGGAHEFTAGVMTNSYTTSSTYLETQASEPYIDAYSVSDGFGTAPLWSAGANISSQYYNSDVCTYETCGGQALYETHRGMGYNSNGAWGGGYTLFPSAANMFTDRGGNCFGDDGYKNVVMYYYEYSNGSTTNRNYTYRVTQINK